MSLKAIHLVFITASFILSLWFAAWAIQDYLHGSKSGLNLVLGILSGAGGAALLIYGSRFLDKMRRSGL